MKLNRYSQNGEEQFIEKYLGHIEKGTYVDIGAGDAVELSNTYALYQIGWRGILVDPFSKDYPNKIEEVRKGDKYCNKVITNYVGEIEQWDIVSANTAEGKYYKELGKRYDGKEFTVFKAPCYTMREFLEEYPEAKNADFANIDIESGEEALLSCCDFAVFKPTLVCIEYLMRGTDFRLKWEHYLIKYYEPKEILEGNIFYLRRPNV